MKNQHVAKEKNAMWNLLKKKKEKNILELVYLVKFTKLDYHNAMETLT